LAPEEPRELQTTGLLFSFGGPRGRPGRTLGEGTHGETNHRSLSPYPQWLMDAWDEDEEK